MTVLRETLERLEYWLWQHHPRTAELLEPGLTSEEIDDQVQNLPIQITQEIKQLYQWANGCSVFALPFSEECIGVMSLEKAIECSYHWRYEASKSVMQIVNLPNLVMFPDYEGLIYCAFCDGDESSPIFAVDGEDPNYAKLAYSSINSMALTTLECYKQQILQIEERGTIRSKDETLLKEFNSIRKRNNAGFNSDAIREQYNLKLKIVME